MAISIESFTNKPVILNFQIAGLSLEMPVFGLPCNVFYILSCLLAQPSHRLLLELMTDEKNNKHWLELKEQIDSSNSWADSVVKYSISKFLDSGQSSDMPLNEHLEEAQDQLFKRIKEVFSDDFLFIAIAKLNSIHHYFDSAIDPLKKNDDEKQDQKKKEPFDPVKGILHVSMVCNKLGISEINGEKISVNNMFDVLTFPQYYYLISSHTIAELITLSNLALSPFGGEMKKPGSKSNIEINYQAYRNIMKALIKYDGTEFREDEWTGKEAEGMIRNRGNDTYTKIYEFFAK